jgi:hypothetical protein
MEPSGSGQEPFAFSCVEDKEPSCSIKLGELLERLRFQILMALEVLIAVFWVVTSCRFVEGYRRFEETYRFQCVCSSILNMMAILFSETSVVTYKTVLRDN